MSSSQAQKSPQHARTHGAAIAPIAHYADALQEYKRVYGAAPTLGKSEIAQLKSALADYEKTATREGVNFSRVQIDDVLAQRDQGLEIEFEAIGPYLADYIASDGLMQASNLIPEDKIGLALSTVLRKVFPKGRLVALCDDYNTFSAHGHYTSAPKPPTTQTFTMAQKKNFKTSLLQLFKANGAIREDADHNLLSESTELATVETLARRLEARGVIRHTKDEGLFFDNRQAENPLHQTFRLRTQQGRWLCEALDAASFLNPINWGIVHVIVLPSYMATQQDRVWEMLRVLDISPHKYHNIFYDPAQDPEAVARTVADAFGVTP